MSRSRHSNFLQTLFDAQAIAFAPFIFKAASFAIKTGLLEAIVREPGLDEADWAKRLGLPLYAVGLACDILVPAKILERDNAGGLSATPVGECLALDDMTRANFLFTDEVNFAGLAKTEEALLEGRPAGLAAFSPEWKTIYPHLPDLPEAAKNAWFRFDHWHSDRAYDAALEILAGVFPEKPAGPAKLADIGGNTGRFSAKFLRRFPAAEAVLVDLPAETETLASRPELAGVLPRLSTASIDWLTGAELRGTEGTDLYWMSQFLDCFSFEEAKNILERTARAMAPGAKLAVLEPLTDEQRHPAAELSLAATSLYFAVMANGNSRFFKGAELRRLFAESGFAIESEHPNLGVSHTLFILSRR